jgi:glycosyltransferase involved in cell wall biosynthesis
MRRVSISLLPSNDTVFPVAVLGERYSAGDRSSGQMKVLMITYALPYPPLTGSALIALHHIKHLAAHHTVDLVSFKSRKNPDQLADLPRWCNSIELVDRPPHWRVLMNMVMGIVRDPHPVVSRARSGEMSKVVDRRLADARYDVVLFQMPMAQFRPNHYPGPTIWNLEEPQALKTQRMLPISPWYSRPWDWIRINRLKHWEKSQASLFDRVTVVNREDSREYGSTIGGARLDWVPSGIDADVFRPSPDIPRRDGMIVITGNMFHPPNINAVEFFCEEVFPLICKLVPSATLWLVGDRPVRRVRKWAADSRIKVTGFVPDIRPYLQQAMVSACPVRLRIGTQTKILEALACGTPVVTSSAGNHGIGGVSGEHLYVADAPEEFAHNIATLLRGERWSELSENGRRFVADNFTWEKSTMKLEQVLEQLLTPSTRDWVQQ